MSVNAKGLFGAQSQSDLMLWLGAAVLGAIGLTWLLISEPWGSSSTAELPDTGVAAPAIPAADGTSASASSGAPASDGGSSLDSPLRMAQLAYDAGMLVEPADYSAWALYAKALGLEPDNQAARAGLERVAGDLLKRSATALEQGRYADARVNVDRILGVMPDFAPATALRDKIRAADTPPPTRAGSAKPQNSPAQAQTDERPAADRPAASQAAERAPARRSTDPVPALHESFMGAMAGNQLLTPADASARHFVELMVAADADHEQTLAARKMLTTEMLSRSKQSVEGLDWDAARTWIEEAAKLDPDPAALASAQETLAEGLIAAEASRLLPASALEPVSYAPPEYPRAAVQRGIEGWVDLEFTVDERGRTRDIVVTDASHTRYFQDEAIEAVGKWEFEPRMFMDRAIPQRAYTRLNFVLTRN